MPWPALRSARFLILGSASPDRVRGVSDSPAGHVGFVDLSGFDGTEVGFDRLDVLWLRGDLHGQGWAAARADRPWGVRPRAGAAGGNVAPERACRLEIRQQHCNISCVIPRKQYADRVRKALGRSPVVALLGPRQCGKTTLARQMMPVGHPQYFDLEDPVIAHLLEQPMTALQGLRELVVIDEAQRQPALFPVLRVLADRAEQPATFLILGSASPDLSRQMAESLAGRVEIIEMRGFDLSELPANAQEVLWLRGGFPRSYLAADEEGSITWRKNFIGTFLERDLAAFGFGLSPALMGRFWTMLAHYHAQLWNGSEIAASLGIAPNTARAYLDALEQTYMIRRLLPWQANLRKRLVKTPKIYFRDSGLFHTLCGIHAAPDLLTHPKLGASWEGFALEEILRAQQPDQAWFFAVHSGSELDLLMDIRGRRIGVEFKRADAPRGTRSMHLAISDTALDELWVVYPGTRSYALDDRITVRPLLDCLAPR